MTTQPGEREARVLVLDTNIVLDLFVYEDPATAPLFALLGESSNRWLATAAMREELARVLSYPQIAKRMNARSLLPETVLLAFDARAEVATTAAKAPYTCKDADDQKFIDLAVAHKAVLLSKDAAVLCMAKRLATLGVQVGRRWPAVVKAGWAP